MWITDPELFLYSKVGGDDVQVWRCKKTMNSSPLVVPMVPDDFEYVSQVEDHSDLVDGDILEWEETDYKALVKYISERRLLVNGQGLVIAELSKFSEEDEDDQTDADILPIYLRSLDILQLKAYIPDLREQPIPSRKVQYLEDADGKAAPVEGGDSTTTTTITTKQIAELQEDLERERSEILELAKRFVEAEVEIKTLEARNVNLDGTNTKLKQDLADAEAENKTLEAMKMKLKQDLAAPEDKVVDLESKKRTLEEKVTKLAAELVVWKQKFTDLESKTSRDQEERITKLNAEIVVLKNKVKDLESTNKTQENRINALNADVSSKTTQLATAQRELTRLNNREPWMNDITPKSGWVGFQELRVIPWATNIQELWGAPTHYTVDDGKSNVATKHWISVRLNHDNYRALEMDSHTFEHVESLRSYAKFDGDFCWLFKRFNNTSFVVSKR